MKRIAAARIFFVVLALDLSPDLFATEPAADQLLEQLPALLEQIKARNDITQRALENPSAINRPQEQAPTVASNPQSTTMSPAVSSLASLSPLRTDPFQISYFMQQKAQARNPSGLQFMPLQNALTPPVLSMKGIVNGGLALLEVQGSGVYLVRQGDTISLNRQGQNLVINIEKIDRLSLMVKVGTLAEIIVVR